MFAKCTGTTVSSFIWSAPGNSCELRVFILWFENIRVRTVSGIAVSIWDCNVQGKPHISSGVNFREDDSVNLYFTKAACCLLSVLTWSRRWSTGARLCCLFRIGSEMLQSHITLLMFYFFCAVSVAAIIFTLNSVQLTHWRGQSQNW